ncbi:MAG TPA: anhydro-N-acetylmuramic acid kinase [Gemmatimonadaceae bacterium]|nr:anhydro-N-acetylmuramic acid kinase [Gemmatimonadaceae bacterium]
MTVVVGLMSGTSLDGISAAVVRVARDGGRYAAELLAYDVLPYDDAQRDRLARALREGTPEEYCRLNFDLGELLARAAIRVIAESGVPRREIAAIASHGQTVWHVPGHSTWQIGEASVIAERVGVPVIADFRVRDMAAGGQGAPLVPRADCLLFSAPHWRALQNIGGIGNVTVVPPNGGTAGVRAFDTGPGVVVIDGVTRALVPGQRYDVDGRLARQGIPVEEAVSAALRDPYFSAPPPKSTGRELFTPDYIAGFIAQCRAVRADATPADIVATAVALTARSIADAYARFLPEPVKDVVLSGGGAKNPALVDAIAALLPGREVVRFDDVFFDGEAKEAVAFALLGYLHLLGESGNVPAATGAAGGRVLGKLTPA